MRVAKHKKKQCVRSPVTNKNLPSKQKLQRLIYIWINEANTPQLFNPTRFKKTSKIWTIFEQILWSRSKAANIGWGVWVPCSNLHHREDGIKKTYKTTIFYMKQIFNLKKFPSTISGETIIGEKYPKKFQETSLFFQKSRGTLRHKLWTIRWHSGR